MKNIDLNHIPSFDDLPVRKGAPAESSWGVFDDVAGGHPALGCLNFLTPAGVVEAARLVKTGKVFRLDAKIGFAKPPLFGRPSVQHNVTVLGPTANDDSLDHFNTQEGSQWDGLGHVGHIRHQLFYDGVKVDETRDGTSAAAGNAKLGIHHWADKFVGRAPDRRFGFRKNKGLP